MIIGNKTFDTKHHGYIMGILNVTPDSFSDGGKYDHLDAALKHADEMVRDGAAIIDVGGESTRPGGYTLISDEEEIARVTPVIEALKKEFDVPVSLDTYKSGVAKAGIEAGADLINDIWWLKWDGFTTEQTIKAENSLLNKIKIGNTIQLYKHTGIFIKDITVDFISNESQLVTEADMQYKRFAVKDNSAPTPDIVDEFVEFIKNKPDDIHLHFHCAAGKGRTTSFMVMYQAMKNNSNLTLEQLLSYQYNIGGVNLHDNNIQYNFLEDFCNYVQKNKDSNYSISYSQWIKES